MYRLPRFDDPDPSYELWNRRAYLVATVGLAALAGCAGAPGPGVETTTTGPGGPTGGSGRTPPAGVSQEVFDDGPVPDIYVSAATLGGGTRPTTELFDKVAVQYVRYAAATQNSAHLPGRSCGNCGRFVRDHDGDGYGACASVAGYIHRGDWCTVYQSLPSPPVPEGMTEADLATAEVPEAYRTAASQVGEVRDPDALETHLEVGLAESVEAIADGDAVPGESCGTCAEFIPDVDGDGWGACARVEGYIAVEDWCERWEHVSAEL